MKPTPWFACREHKPVRAGWYDVRWAGDRFAHPFRLYWTGEKWARNPVGNCTAFGLPEWRDHWRGRLKESK